jgi:hypothetical protein
MVIAFDPAAHRYTVDGVVFPGVTHILGAEGLRRDVERYYDEYGRERGRIVHETIRLYHEGRLDPMNVDPVVEPYLDAWVEFLKDSKYQPMDGGVEVRLAAPAIRVAGTADSIGSYEGRAAILDIKTGGPHPSTGIQLAGYEYLYQADPEHDGTTCRRIGVYLNAEGKYKLVEYKDRHDRDVFLAAVRLFHWKTENLKGG